MANFLTVLNNIEDQIVVNYYKKFVGEDELHKLLASFEKVDFLGKWQQVLTSLSTGLFGTGITFSSVEAIYSKKDDNLVNVLNRAYDENFKEISITGVSRARSSLIPTCRTVKFPSVPAPEGDYWIIYISESCNSIVVASPIITPLIPIKITDNFALYVLTKDRDSFWKTPKEQNEIFETLNKYGFNNFWNKGIFSGVSNTHN